MKTRIVLLIAVVFFTAMSLTAQISVPSDSIKTALCHKWNFKAIIMGGQRLTNMDESVTYEFISDGTFKRVSSNGKLENGTWSYKPDQKIILLKIKKTALHIPSLSSTELIVSPGDGMNQTKNGLGMGTVLKPAENN
jgi:hypothetical protein